VITIHQRHRRTDGRHAIPRPRICTKVHCAVTLWYADVTPVRGLSNYSKVGMLANGYVQGMQD